MELDQGGGVIRFEIDDRCVKSTGRFLEILVEIILNLRIEETNRLALCQRCYFLK
jgi:activator of 2-hydroxyglutaryl-CoA dehydratase